MQSRRTTDKIRGWTRIGAKIGVLLADPKVRSEISELLKDRVSSMAGTVNDKYDNVVHRVQDARDALRGRRQWQAPAVGFLVGMGVGASLGILLVPTSGGNTPEAIRERAVNVKNKVVESASTAIGRPAKSMA